MARAAKKTEGASKKSNTPATSQHELPQVQPQPGAEESKPQAPRTTSDGEEPANGAAAPHPRAGERSRDPRTFQEWIFLHLTPLGFVSLVLAVLVTPVWVWIIIRTFLERDVTALESATLRFAFCFLGGMIAGGFAGSGVLWINGVDALLGKAGVKLDVKGRFTAGFAVFALILFFWPLHTDSQSTHLQLVSRDPNESFDGDFNFEYNLDVVAGKLASGKCTNGEAEIKAVPPGCKKIEIISFSHPRLEIDRKKDDDGTWGYDLVPGAIIKVLVKRKYVRFSEPTADEVLAEIEKARKTKAEILTERIKKSDRPNVTFKILNHAGIGFTICFCDCYWAYNPRGKLDPAFCNNEKMLDPTIKEKNVHDFALYKGDSGWFAFYIDYETSDGHHQRRSLGVHNVLDEPVLDVQHSSIDSQFPFEPSFSQ